MRKKYYSVVSVLCSSLLAALGLAGCKSHSTSRNAVECVYGGPPVIYEEKVDTIIIQRETKVVYGPPVVEVRDPDWRTAKPDEEGVYDVAEVMPQFEGGDEAMTEWINSHLNYPEEANGVRGRVVVSFTVMTDGSLDGVTVLRPVHPLLDAEAVRVIQAMPKWLPGRMNGEAVPVRYFVPVNF